MAVEGLSGTARAGPAHDSVLWVGTLQPPHEFVSAARHRKDGSVPRVGVNPMSQPGDVHVDAALGRLRAVSESRVTDATRGPDCGRMPRARVSDTSRPPESRKLRARNVEAAAALDARNRWRSLVVLASEGYRLREATEKLLSARLRRKMHLPGAAASLAMSSARSASTIILGTTSSSPCAIAKPTERDQGTAIAESISPSSLLKRALPSRGSPTV
jgi:hypothetical protein